METVRTCVKLDVVREMSFVDSVDRLVVLAFFASYVLVGIFTVAVVKYIKYHMAAEHSRQEASCKINPSKAGRHGDIEEAAPYDDDSDSYFTLSSICQQSDMLEKLSWPDKNQDSISATMSEPDNLITHYVNRQTEAMTIAPATFKGLSFKATVLMTFVKSRGYETVGRARLDLPCPLENLLVQSRDCKHGLAAATQCSSICALGISGSNPLFHYFGSIILAYAKHSLYQLVLFCFNNLKMQFCIPEKSFHYLTSIVEQRLHQIQFDSMDSVIIFPELVDRILCDLDSLLHMELLDSLQPNHEDYEAINPSYAKALFNRVREQFSSVPKYLLKVYSKHLLAVHDVACERGRKRIRMVYDLWTSAKTLRMRIYDLMQSIRENLANDGRGLEEWKVIAARYMVNCRNAFTEVHHVYYDQSKDLMGSFLNEYENTFSRHSDDLQKRSTMLHMQSLSKSYNQEALSGFDAFGSEMLSIIEDHYKMLISQCMLLDEQVDSTIATMHANIVKAKLLKLSSCEEMLFGELMQAGFLSKMQVLSLAEKVQQRYALMEESEISNNSEVVRRYISDTKEASTLIHVFLEGTIFLISAHYKLSCSCIEMLLKSVGSTSKGVHISSVESLREKLSVHIISIAALFICHFHELVPSKLQSQIQVGYLSKLECVNGMIRDLQNFWDQSTFLSESCFEDSCEEILDLLIKVIYRLHVEQTEVSSRSMFTLLREGLSCHCLDSISSYRRQWLSVHWQLHDALEVIVCRGPTTGSNNNNSEKSSKRKSKSAFDVVEDVYESQCRLRAAKLSSFKSQSRQGSSSLQSDPRNELSPYGSSLETVLTAQRNYAENVSQGLSGLLESLSMDSLFCKKHTMDGFLKRLLSSKDFSDNQMQRKPKLVKKADPH